MPVTCTHRILKEMLAHGRSSLRRIYSSLQPGESTVEGVVLRQLCASRGLGRLEPRVLDRLVCGRSAHRVDLQHSLDERPRGRRRRA